MRTSLLSGRTLRRHQEVVKEYPSFINKKLKEHLEITPPQVDFDFDVDVDVGVGEKKKKKLELNDFPAEILIDILSRLPIPSILGAAKYTCKLWKLLVSDPMFLELYATENPGCLYTLRGDSNLYFAVNWIDDKPVGMKLLEDMGNIHKYRTIDSCHGLLCYGDIREKYIYVCNPIIGDVVKIPIQHGVIVLLRGLGYAPLSKKYKLFQLYFGRQPNKKPSRFAAAVFTLGGGDSWRDVDPTQLLANVSDPMFLELYATENPGCLYTLRGDSNLYFAVNWIDDKPVGMKLLEDMGNIHKYRTIDSCHGLLCYGDIREKYIYVCNPIIGDVVKIPIQHGVIVLLRGLGYAPLSKKYKLFQLYFGRQPNKKPSRFAAAVFTLGGGDSWRDVDPTQLLANVRFISKNIYCNGSLYWKTTVPPNESNSEAHVISFDLETETFRLRRVLPVGTNHTSPRYTRYLTVLGETVAYVICSHRGLQEVWMLVDELEDIWVEKYRFSVPTPGVDDVHFTLSGLWQDKEMYGMEYTITRKTGPGPGRFDVITEKKFLSYKADSKTYKPLQLPFPMDINADAILPQLVISHVGSFISPSKIVAAGRRQPSLDSEHEWFDHLVLLMLEPLPSEPTYPLHHRDLDFKFLLHFQSGSDLRSLGMASHTPKNILITGAAGFIASHVANRLIRNYPDYKIVVLDKLDYCSNLKNLLPCRSSPNFKFVKGDIGSADLVNYLLITEAIDTIMHFAAQTHVDNSFGNSFEFTKNNIYGTHVLLEACKVTGQIKRFIHVSTDEVYGETDEDAVVGNHEASQLLPTNPYSATKAGAEMLVMAYGRVIKFVENRPFNDQRYFLDDQKLTNLGWSERTTWEEGLRKTKDWYTSNPDWWGDVSGALLPHPRMLMMPGVERQFEGYENGNAADRPGLILQQKE
ncbi:dTDP-glucose 4,6-dehydratase [Thalictrum thalictroides]|uniref:dTDP-glucose 4,6-dehydratase n=1 Tax=Thalictrum thalictroides TaxID=46969 RepID=A0A7J6V071_THATH|nr:dTDP-glucose 4,6-dehydratase [Thalictrum thalictroides]